MDSIMATVDSYLQKGTVVLRKLAVSRVSRNDAGLLNVIYVAVYLGIAVAAGAITLYITNQVVLTTGTPSQANLSAAQTSLLGTAQTGYSFLPIVVVAAIGSIAIGYVFGLIPRIGGGRGGEGGAL